MDVARVDELPPTEELKDVVELLVEPAPLNGRHRLGAGTYVFVEWVSLD